jgi:hypothetical protein
MFVMTAEETAAHKTDGWTDARSDPGLGYAPTCTSAAGCPGAPGTTPSSPAASVPGSLTPDRAGRPNPPVPTGSR